jgi:uncharacterized membrane protein
MLESTNTGDPRHIRETPKFLDTRDTSPGPWATITLVCGILSILSCCSIIGSIIFGLAAFIFGWIEMNRESSGQAPESGKQITYIGIILGIIGFFIGIAGVLALIFATDNFQEMFDSIIEEFEDQYI